MTNKFKKEEVMLRVKLFNKEAVEKKECQFTFVKPVNG